MGIVDFLFISFSFFGLNPMWFLSVQYFACLLIAFFISWFPYITAIKYTTTKNVHLIFFVSFDLTLGNIQVSSVCFPFVSVSTDLFKQNAIHFDQLFYQSIRIEFVMVNWAREFSFAHYVFIGQKCNLILMKNTFISFRIFVHSIVCVAKKNGTGFYITRKKSIIYSCLIANSMHFKYEFYSKRIFESTCI